MNCNKCGEKLEFDRIENGYRLYKCKGCENMARKKKKKNK